MLVPNANECSSCPLLITDIGSSTRLKHVCSCLSLYSKYATDMFLSNAWRSDNSSFLEVFLSLQLIYQIELSMTWHSFSQINGVFLHGQINAKQRFWICYYRLIKTFPTTPHKLNGSFKYASLWERALLKLFSTARFHCITRPFSGRVANIYNVKSFERPQKNWQKKEDRGFTAGFQ